MDFTPVLGDGVLTLNGYELADAAAQVAGEDEEHARRFGWFPEQSTMQTVEAAIRRWQDHWQSGGSTRTFAIRHQGELVGGVELRLGDERRAQVSYWIFPHARRRKFATRAVRMAVDWAFDELGQDSIEAFVEPSNVASRSVLRAVGFTEDPEPTMHPISATEMAEMTRYCLGPTGLSSVLLSSVLGSDQQI